MYYRTLIFVQKKTQTAVVLAFVSKRWVFQSDVLQRNKNVDFADEEKYFTQYVSILLHISRESATEREHT